MSSEDLLAYLKLEAEVHDGYTIHRSYKRNRAAGVLEKTETRWDRTRCIGEGTFGEVWHEHNLLSGGRHKARAVKVIRKDRMENLQIDYKKELLALATFSKQEYRQAEVLVSFLNWFENDGHIFLAMEYFEYGDLASHISSISTEDEVRQITNDLLEGLNIIHRENFAHRDLKPQNIFVVEKPPKRPRWWVKIGDFGISKRVRNEETALRTQTGTPFFQAPEIHGFVGHDEETSAYDNSADVWSLGCVVYNIAANRVPFTRPIDLNGFCQKRLQLPKEPLSQVLGEAGIEFVTRLLVPEPARRMTIAQALQNPWILYQSSTQLIEPVSTHAISQGIPATGSLSETRSRASTVFDTTKHNMQQQNGHSQQTTPEALALQHQGQVSLRPASLPSLPTESTSHVPRRKPVPSESVSTVEYNSNGLVKVKGHKYPIEAVAFSQRNALLASCSRDHTIRLWDMANGNLVHELLGHKDWVTTVSFSPDGHEIASGSSDKTIRLWSIDGMVLSELLGHQSAVNTVSYTSHGNLLVSGSSDGTIRIWHAKTGQQKNVLFDSTATGILRRIVLGSTGVIRVLTVAVSEQSGLVAAGFEDGSIKIWHQSTGKHYKTLSGHKSDVCTLAFTSYGIWLASGSSDRTVRLWKVKTGEAYRTPFTHTSAVLSISVSADGTFLASSCGDSLVRIWDRRGGVNAVCHTLSCEEDRDNVVNFSPDGKRIAAGSSKGTIRVWYQNEWKQSLHEDEK